VAAQVHRQPAIHLDVGGEQRRCRGGLAQQGGGLDRQLVDADADLRPGVAQVHAHAAHAGVREEEAVEAVGIGRGLAHGLVTDARCGRGDNGGHVEAGTRNVVHGGARPGVQAERARMSRRRGRRRWLRRLLMLPVVLVLFSVLQVAVLRFVDPPLSMVMAEHQLRAWIEGDDDFRLQYEWRDLDRIASHLPLAAIAAEDQRFAEHRGFDLEAIERAREQHAQGGRLRGASTISQQTAKNVFLWSGRSWVRKGLEAWYTVLMELMWPKQRILEMYVNVAEFG